MRFFFARAFGDQIIGIDVDDTGFNLAVGYDFMGTAYFSEPIRYTNWQIDKYRLANKDRVKS